MQRSVWYPSVSFVNLLFYICICADVVGTILDVCIG